MDWTALEIVYTKIQSTREVCHEKIVGKEKPWHHQVERTVFVSDREFNSTAQIFELQGLLYMNLMRERQIHQNILSFHQVIYLSR